MPRYDYSSPQRMTPAALFIILMKTFRATIAPFITVLLFSIPKISSEDTNITSIIIQCFGGCVVVSITGALLSYFSKKFYIHDGNLIFIHGIIKREDTIVPLDRVHSLRTKMGLWYRMLDMRGIVFDTLATKHEDIELILDEHDWQQLLSLIEKEERSPSSQTPPEYDPSSTVRFPTKNLLLAALCQNHLKGMAALGSIFALIFGNLPELDEDVTGNLASFLENNIEDTLYSPLRIILFLAIIYMVILLLWLGRVLLKYYDMTLKYNKNCLTFTFGLLTRVSSRFLHDKICTIRIKRNFLEKKFGFSTIMLKQALNASAEKEKDKLKLYGTDDSAFFLQWWLGENFNNLPYIMSAKSGRGVFFHSIIFPFLLGIGVTIILIHFQLYLWILVPLLYLFYSLGRGIRAMQQSRVILHPSYFTIHTGAFAEIANYVKYSDLEVVRIRRTPFTRFFHRVTLVLSTPGSTFHVRSIKEEEALTIFEILLSLQKN